MSSPIYDLGGNLRRTLSSAGISDYLYDSLNRLEVLTHYRPDQFIYPNSDLTLMGDNLAIARYEYTVRADGKRTAVTETLGYDLDGEFQPDVEETIEIDWFYDNLGRLIEEDYDSSNNALDFTADYVFDLVGNRLTKTVDHGRDAVVDEAITYEYDLNDRLLTESLDSDVPQANGVDQTTAYGYDQTQQTSKIVWQGTDTDPQTGTRLSETTYTYNQQGRMASADVDLDADGHADNRSEYAYLCPCQLAIADFSADSSCPGTEKRVGGAGGGDSSPCSPAGGGRNRARQQADGAHPWQDARAAGLEARAWRFRTVNVITLAG